MTKFLASLALILASGALTLAQYWFTFGLWPKSWLSFVLCTSGYIVIYVFRTAMEKENK